MFSSPTPAPGSRAIASNALRSAGLIDRDATMRDLTDKPGGRKASSKIRSHRPRILDMKDLRDPRLRAASSSHAGPSDPLTIRGAARVKVRKLPGGAEVPRVKTKVKAVEVWKEVVQKRFNAEAQFLNLESLIDDELVKKHNLMPPGRGGDARDAAVIFKLASQLKPKVQTLSLASNNLQGKHLQFLSHYLPDLINLSLQNNNIRFVSELDFLASRKGRLEQLRELILLGNPIHTLGMQQDNGEKYRRDVTTKFLTLEVLDQVAIAKIAFDRPGPSTTPAEKPTATTFPCEMSPSFVTGVDSVIVSNFLVRFFNALDTNRNGLIDAYDPNATFSFSANTTIAERARIQGFHTSTSMPNQTKLTWKAWLAGGSRNLSRINSDFDRALKSLHIGAQEAVNAIVALPATKHDISGPPEKFCLDSFPVVHGQGMGLLLTVHGEFTEVSTGGIRSFDRSFILTPAPEGSRAKLSGWDVVIVSDQWTIRVYSSHEAWKPGPLLVQALSREEEEAKKAAATAPVPQPPQPNFSPQAQAALASMPEPQRNLVMQVCQRTGLNVDFAVQCLASNEWNFDRAVANFEQVKGTLARDAFL